MDMESNRRNSMPQPPPLEEGYWESLLRDGEYAEPVHYNDFPSPYHQSTNLYEPSTSVTTRANHADNAEVEQDWQDIEMIMDADETVELVVMGYNRGGLLVEWRNIRGFVPASQLIEFPTDATAAERHEALMTHIDRTLTLRVIELNREQNRLVLSERAAQAEAGERAYILESLQPGDVIEGDVTNICDFGAFVDLGGLEGLIHISELSWGRVSHPADVLKRGEQVRVYVLDTDQDAGRVALSIKRLYPDPWQTVEDRYEVGEIVEGRITNVVDFGAFACIESGLEGLIHVSELAEGHFLHPRNVVAEGQIVRARILSIDSRARRLGLSLRGLQQPDQ